MIHSNPFQPSGHVPEPFEFCDHDVLSCNFERRRRRSELYKAVSLGSICARRVRLCIEGKTMCRIVDTRAVAIGMNSLFIERSEIIPIASILKVEIDLLMN